MSSYYCVYQSSSSICKKSSSGILTVTGCTCNGYCPSDTYSKSEGSEGLQYKQESCGGHRLVSTNLRGKIFPTIANRTAIRHDQYNTLRALIDEELTARKLSNLYKNEEKGSISEIPAGQYIIKQLLANLNAFISNSAFYKDTVKTPTLTIDHNDIESSDINKSVRAILNLIRDCICYSDCNSYSMCYCYGNCNHY